MADSVFKEDILRGKVVLITGGGTGIGFEIARQFGLFSFHDLDTAIVCLGLHGACVCILGRRESVIEEAVSVLRKSGINATKAKADVRNETECTAALNHTLKVFGGSLDILVNAAAGNFLAKAEDLTLKGFRTVMEIDAFGVFNMCRVCFPHLRASRGSILNISMTLHYGASWFQLHASAAKSAIDSMTRSLALEWGQYGIRVNGIAPGPIADTAGNTVQSIHNALNRCTGMSKLAPAAADALESGMRREVPLGRFGTKTEIAMTCLFVVSSAASYISGCTVVADGGHWLYRNPTIDPNRVSRASRALEQTTKDVGRATNSKL
eukprot:g5969.t1